MNRNEAVVSGRYRRSTKFRPPVVCAQNQPQIFGRGGMDPRVAQRHAAAVERESEAEGVRVSGQRDGAQTRRGDATRAVWRGFPRERTSISGALFLRPNPTIVNAMHLTARVDAAIRRHRMLEPGRARRRGRLGRRRFGLPAPPAAGLAPAWGLPPHRPAPRTTACAAPNPTPMQQFVARWRGASGCPSSSRRPTAGAAGNLEQEAPARPHGLLPAPAGAGPVDRVAAGHTRSDQAETVLFRFLRGSGTAGLAGIRPVTGWGLVRPLLDIEPRGGRSLAASAAPSLARGFHQREPALRPQPHPPRPAAATRARVEPRHRRRRSPARPIGPSRRGVLGRRDRTGLPRARRRRGSGAVLRPRRVFAACPGRRPAPGPPRHRARQGRSAVDRLSPCPSASRILRMPRGGHGRGSSCPGSTVRALVRIRLPPGRLASQPSGSRSGAAARSPPAADSADLSGTH